MSILAVKMTDTPHYNLDELSALADLPRRTVRYYIQMGLIPRPTGAGRGAHYTADHLDRLLEVRKWVNAGLSLERIGELVTEQDTGEAVPPPPRRKPGTVEVWSHIVIDQGIELTLEPKQAGLSPEAVRALAEAVTRAYQELKEGKE